MVSAERTTIVTHTRTGAQYGVCSRCCWRIRSQAQVERKQLQGNLSRKGVVPIIRLHVPGVRCIFVELSGTRHGARPPDRCPTQPRERPRRLKKKMSATADPRDGSLPALLNWRGRRSNSLPSNIGLAGVRSFCSMKMKPSSGVLPCPGRAGGAKPNVLACPSVH